MRVEGKMHMYSCSIDLMEAVRKLDYKNQYKICYAFYDENGKETERILLDANGENRMLVVEKECLESGSVLFESKDGAYEPLGEEDILTK